MSTDKPVYAFRLDVENTYGTVKIRAYIVRVENGEFLNPGYSWPYEDQGYADLYVTQFANNGKPTGSHVEYGDVHTVDLPRAERMVKTLRTVTRGLDKLRNTEGYIDSNDLPALLFRVARILKINQFYVRNTRDNKDRSGERWRKAEATSVQAWYSQALDTIGQGNVSAYDS